MRQITDRVTPVKSDTQQTNSFAQGVCGEFIGKEVLEYQITIAVRCYYISLPMSRVRKLVGTAVNALLIIHIRVFEAL